MLYPTIDLKRLTVGGRLQLIEQVWDSLRREAPVLPLSEDELALIQARQAEHRKDPGSAVAWESVRADLLNDQEGDEQQEGSLERS